ncbi:MAG: hypothetical protein WC454_01225 [Phycisphaerae bacterium]|jgi:hypothetical protein
MTYARLMLERFEAGLNNFASPFLETLQPYKTRDIFIGLVILLTAFAVFASLSTEAIANGDAAIYLQQMKNLNFTDRSVHLGYYLLGAGFIRLLPGSDDHAINLMNCFLGAICIMLVYLITFIICHKYIPAVVASLLLFTHYLFLENSVYAEVYTPQVCFLLLSILLWLLDKPILAALSFLLSFLITPSSILALPCFFILRPRLRPLLLFCAIFAISAAVVIFPVWQSYFFGSRGLLNVANRPLDLGWVLDKEGREIFSGFFPCLALIVVGLLEIFGRKQLRPFAFALLMLWLVTLFSAEKIPDVSPQMPVYAMLCVVGGLGLALLLRISNNKAYIKFTIYAVMVAVIFAVFMNGLYAFEKIQALNKCRTGYRNTVIRINKVADPDYLVIGYWSIGILFEHYLFQKSFTPLWINTEWLDGTCGRQQQDESIKKYSQAVAAHRQIWLFGNYFEPIENLQQDGYKITRFDSVQFTPAGPVIPIYVANAEK